MNALTRVTLITNLEVSNLMINLYYKLIDNLRISIWSLIIPLRPKSE